MHLPASKDGTSSGLGPAQETVLDTNVRKLDGSSSTPASPSSSPKAMSTREKPQKVLPCPRCESMNTKFCYYNNYSVNQPRHFCRQCQRYWTVGGTLRNVPVGGGSRKKNRHQQRGEPYLIRTGTGTGPLAMAPATTTTTTTTTTSGINMAPPLNTFPHDMTGFNFSQLPGFVHPVGAAYPVDQPGLYINSLSSKPQEFAAMQPMYGAMNPHTVGGSLMYPDLAALQLAEHPGAVKAEFWGNHHVMQANWNGNQAQVNQGDQVGHAKTVNSAKSGSYDSSMLLHLGLNSRPHMNGKPAPWTSNNNNQENHHTRGGHAVNGTSPPHGSSTIEEEGSTPTNGYSNSGYEEGDTVSSMWQEMHDMQDIFQ